jgi:hypothetical protein
VITVGTFFGIFATRLPVLAVLVAGFLLLAGAGRRLPPRSVLLARVGLAVILTETLGAMTWSALLPQLLAWVDYRSGSFRSYSIVNGVLSFLLAVLLAAGIGLLLAALLTMRQPGPAPAPYSHQPPPGPVPPGPVQPGPVPPGPVPPGPVPPGPVPPGPVPPGPVPPGPVPPGSVPPADQ